MKKIIYLLAIAALTLSSCDVNDPIYNTPHPDKGKLTIITDWTKRTDGVAIPSSYTARVGTEQATLSGTTAEYPHTLTPRNYTLYVYNTADKITVNGNTATAATVSAGVIESSPNWFFSGKATTNIEADKLHNITVAMKQQVCQLDITLTVTEGEPARISSVAGTLTGVAGAWDFDTDSPNGSAVSVKPTFTRSGDKINASMRLLGITGAEQKLTLVVTFSDNSTQTIEKDVSSLLTGFNTDKHISAGITADVQTPMEVEFTCTINNWTNVDRSGTAN